MKNYYWTSKTSCSDMQFWVLIKKADSRDHADIVKAVLEHFPACDDWWIGTAGFDSWQEAIGYLFGADNDITEPPG